jgi:hypothetical protein
MKTWQESAAGSDATPKGIKRERREALYGSDTVQAYMLNAWGTSNLEDCI